MPIDQTLRARNLIDSMRSQLWLLGLEPEASLLRLPTMLQRHMAHVLSPMPQLVFSTSRAVVDSAPCASQHIPLQITTYIGPRDGATGERHPPRFQTGMRQMHDHLTSERRRRCLGDDNWRPSSRLVASPAKDSLVLPTTLGPRRTLHIRAHAPQNGLRGTETCLERASRQKCEG